ncbi:hypothetical protein IWW38_003955 [Coemansia aciculifera]|uniref:Uncharacterized protein n=1 Tax=Coemansia aciculifera TaxID=417176 RepID=A0ACC1LYX6_9FUNG|nr:hypothetical protein IWW38_003955 [Coemansia aciculifera]
MRVFVIPITRTRWALYCHPANIAPTRLTKWAGVASEKWSKWSTYPTTTWRGKIYAYGETLMDKIDFKEYFLKEIPSKDEGALVSKADIIAPSFVAKTEVLKELDLLVKTQIPYHSKWMKISCYLLPVTSLFTLIPVIPNFPLFYNLFRVYSHYKAQHGAKHLAHLLESRAFEVVQDSELARWYERRERGESVMGLSQNSASSESLGSTTAARSTTGQSTNGRLREPEFDQDTLESGTPLLEDPALVSDSDIAEMALYFDAPAFEHAVRRARHQIIAQAAKPPRQS